MTQVRKLIRNMRHMREREESDRLGYSRVEAHQRAGLDHWSAAGAICLIAWVHPARGVCLIPWGITPAWCNHHALPWETAMQLAWSPGRAAGPLIGGLN